MPIHLAKPLNILLGKCNFVKIANLNIKNVFIRKLMDSAARIFTINDASYSIESSRFYLSSVVLLYRSMIISTSKTKCK